jgi:hypothetical protein
LAARYNIVTDLDVPHHAGHAANHAALADDRATGNADATRDDRVRAIRVLCPICTWLSILTPSSITVLPIAPRSIVEFAPISTSLPMTTAPSCGTLTYPPLVGGVTKAIGADDGARVQQAALPDLRGHGTA